MSRVQQASKRKPRSKAIPLLGAAGVSLSLASGASADIGVPAADMPTRNTGVHHEITLGEEEISDVSLATFYIFDKETESLLRRGLKLAAGGGCGSHGCGACAASGGGCAARSCAASGGGCAASGGGDAARGCAGRGCRGCACGGGIWVGACGGCAADYGSCWQWDPVQGWIYVCD